MVLPLEDKRRMWLTSAVRCVISLALVFFLILRWEALYASARWLILHFASACDREMILMTSPVHLDTVGFLYEAVSMPELFMGLGCTCMHAYLSLQKNTQLVQNII